MQKKKGGKEITGLSATRPPPDQFGKREVNDTLKQSSSPFDKTELPESKQKPPAGFKQALKKLGYRVTRRIGKGGMGSVFRGFHEASEKLVAIKFLSEELSESPNQRTRFFREAELIRQIDHPNIVKILESGEIEGRPFFVMEFLEGTSLDQILFGKKERKKTLDLKRALHIASEVCKALDAAHSKGIIHRDIKASNVFIMDSIPGSVEEKVKVIDFGLAFIPSDDPNAPRLTKTGAMLGTPHYLPPEIAKGEIYDHRVDIYSLGIMMYEMISGGLPFKGNAHMALIYKHVMQKPKPMRKARPDLNIPEEVEAIVMRAIEKKPKNRFDKISEMRQAIDSCRRDPYSIPERILRGARKIVLPLCLSIAAAFGAIYHKDSIKSLFIEKPKPEIIEKKDFYTAKINANISGVEVWEEKTLKDGSVVDEKIGKTPLSRLFFGSRKMYLKKEGYEPFYFEISEKKKRVDHTMQRMIN
jgi:serine/threonine protein kinase